MHGTLLRIPAAEIDETFIGTPLLVTVDAITHAGGLSDVEPHTRGDIEPAPCDHIRVYTANCRWLYLAGHRVLIADTDYVVGEPSPTALAAAASEQTS